VSKVHGVERVETRLIDGRSIRYGGGGGGVPLARERP